jgi:hypothetical protein
MSIFSKVWPNYNSKTGVLRSFFVVAAVGIFLYACQKNPDTTPVDCSGPAKSFATNVNPVIQASCATSSGCHGTGSNNGPGPLLNYSQVFNARSDIRSTVSSGHMPPNGTLSATDKSAIICWIDNGSPNN